MGDRSPIPLSLLDATQPINCRSKYNIWAIAPLDSSVERSRLNINIWILITVINMRRCWLLFHKQNLLWTIHTHCHNAVISFQHCTADAVNYTWRHIRSHHSTAWQRDWRCYWCWSCRMLMSPKAGRRRQQSWRQKRAVPAEMTSTIPQWRHGCYRRMHSNVIGCCEILLIKYCLK